MSRKWFLIWLAILLSSCKALASNKVKWLVSDFPPCHIVAGSAKGYCDEMGELIFQKVNDFRFEKEHTSFSRRNALLAQGEHFCSLDLLHNEERAKNLEYSLPMYPILPIGALVRKNHLSATNFKNAPFKAQNLRSDIVLGLEKARFYGNPISSFLSRIPPSQKYYSDSLPRLGSMLLAGRVDILLVSPAELTLFFPESSNINSIDFIPHESSPMLYGYVACTSSSFYPNLIDEINSIIRYIGLDEFIHHYRKWLPDDMQDYYSQKVAEFKKVHYREASINMNPTRQKNP